MKRIFLAAAAALALASCATATPYQPIQTRGATTGGFYETRISSDRFRVTFQGNSLTDRERVERYLLYRAAEVTLGEGYDWFALADRHTERDTRQVVTADPDPFYDSYYWRPNWYYGRGARWYPYSFYDPFPRYEVDEITRYQATAEIVLGHGAKPAGDRSTFNAQDVVNNLGPTIVRPS